MATIQQAKRYLFVHEADPAKGGAPLAELQKELKNDSHREQLFDDEHRVTEWHRIQAFQVVSLVRIAEDMLRQLDGFDAGVSLYIPGSLLVQRLVFKTPVVLYVSRHNWGATAAAQELCLRFPEISVTESLVLPQAGPPGGVLGRAISQGSLHRVASRLVVEMQSSAASSQAQVVDATQETITRPTHFLLYLNEQTYVDDDGALAGEVREALAAGLPVAMIHEKDEARHGCDFGRFFETTPKDLIDGGLYNALAVAFMSGDAYRAVSEKLFAKNLGAEDAKREGAATHLGKLKKSLPSWRSSRNSMKRGGRSTNTELAAAVSSI